MPIYRSTQVHNESGGPQASVHSGMGAIPYEGGAAFRVWAPFASAVHVAGTFNDWSESAHPLAGEGNGYWSIDIAGAKPGDQYKYVISNGTNNPGNVKMVAGDLTTAGACSPVACAATQIRKVNIALSGRNRTLGNNPRSMPLRNTLQSQVALRGMAFVDRYRG